MLEEATKDNTKFAKRVLQQLETTDWDQKIAEFNVEAFHRKFTDKQPARMGYDFQTFFEDQTKRASITKTAAS